MGRGAFLLGLGLAGATVCVGVYQVPQPVRGYLVAFLFVSLVLGLLGLRLVRCITGYRQAMAEMEAQALARRPLSQRPASRPATAPRSSGLRVTASDTPRRSSPRTLL